jgi:PiT family inorganic phosphate transporter
MIIHRRYLMDINLVILVGLIALALFFDFTNGFHDAANSVAAIVGTKTLKAKFAPLFAAVFNFSAYFVVGTAVANTVAKTVNSEYINYSVVFSALLSAIIWNYFTWKKGMPSSSSHALLGGLVGAGLVVGGLDAISMASVQKAVIGLTITPFVGFGIAFIAMWLVKGFQKITKLTDNSKAFKGTQLVTSAAVSFGHGANDAQKTMGIIAALLLASGHTVMDGKNVIVPEWVALLSYLVIALGTWWGGWKIIQTMGMRLIKLRANSGAAADIGASVAIFGATATGVPISTTHAATTAILGAGVAEGAKAKWKLFGSMLLTWITTVPATLAISAGLYTITKLPHIFAAIILTGIVVFFIIWAVKQMINSLTSQDIEKELASS